MNFLIPGCQEVEMAENIATITSKGQVTIPKEIRQALQVKENDQLLFVVEGSQAVIIPLKQRPLTRPYPGMDAIREEIRKELGERMLRGEE
jgi:AbrB family looped-hinge helix DNA binding protein